MADKVEHEKNLRSETIEATRLRRKAIEYSIDQVIAKPLTLHELTILLGLHFQGK
jgi:hypothetical protein